MDSLLGPVVFAIVVSSLYHSLKKKSREDAEEVEVHGGCHCGSVRWKIRCLRRTCAWVCNCSVCNMKQNHHIVVNDDSFFLEQCADDALTTYTFGTHAAKHHFCKTCGVQSFYKPRSNPNGVGVTMYCIDDMDEGVLRIERTGFDGQNWEHTYAGSTGSQITAFSKK